MPEGPSHRRGEVRAWSLHVQVDHADVAQLGRPGDERVEQDGRDRGGGLDVELVPRADAGDGLG